MTNYSKARDEYLESEILSAGPVRRVQMLYEGAINAIARARLALAAKDILARAAQVNKAMAILTELAVSLDHSGGASVTRELAEIYDFAQRSLLDGSATQTDKPFNDAEQVLKTVLEAWKSIPEVEAPSAPSASSLSASPYTPLDYGAGDGFSVGQVGSSLNQLG